MLFKVEKYTVAELAQRLNRTDADVRQYLRAKGFTPGCGVYTVNRATKETGYAASQLVRAARALGMTWRRNSEQNYAITPDQLKRMCDYLRDEK